MENFEYYAPTKTIFGAGQRHQLGEAIKKDYKKALLVVGKGPFRENGAYSDVKASLNNAGVETVEMTDIDQNPRLSSVREGSTVCKENGVDCVVALGGGSVMDCSKVIAAAAKSDIDPYEFLWGKRPDITDSLDIITIPTLAATGSEVNPYAVIVNDETKEKNYCVTKHPTIALMDPELTKTVPLNLTIWGGMDILSHTFEFYFNGNMGSEFQLNFSEAIIRSTMDSIEKLVKDSEDVVARGELMWDAVMAWGGLTKIGQGDPDMACHSIEESFSGYFDTHHGACLGVLTPRWMEQVNADALEIFARFGRNIFGIDEADDVAAAAKAVAEYKIWLKKIGAPITYFDFSSKAFADEELEHVAKTVSRIYSGTVGVIKKLDKSAILEVLKAGKVEF
jgi:alcohol dehydrogenase